MNTPRNTPPVPYKLLPLPPNWREMKARELFDLSKPLTDQVYDLNELPGWRERCEQAERYKASLPEFRFPELMKLDKLAHYPFFWNGVPFPLPKDWQRYGRPLEQWKARGYGTAQPAQEQQAPAFDIPEEAEPPFDFAPFIARRFNMANLHEKPLAVFTLAGQAISTPGNLTSIFSQAKSGKSAVIGAIIGASISNGGGGDFLGWGAPLNIEGAALIHLDTEQSPYDHEQIVLNALKRAGLKEPPPWFYSYCLTDIPPKDRHNFIAHELERAKQVHGAIFAVLIDGVGDLVLDTNDLAESNNVVTELHGLAIKFSTVFVLNLHENPDSAGKGTAKMRGHLGSEMERISESNVRLVKDKDDVTTQYTGKSRHAAITEAKGPRFAFDTLKGMHATTGAAEEMPSEDDRRVVAEVYRCPENVGGLSWTKCHERIEVVEGLKRAGARKRFARYERLKLIVKNPNAKDLYIGEGYAAEHPALLGAYMKTCAADFQATTLACALWEIAEAIERAACNVAGHMAE